jgi:dihydropteroate synthase
VRNRFILHIKGKPYTLGPKAWIMGVINVTPDSFSDPGTYFEKDNAISRGLELVAEGADILDIGGESTRPGSDSVPVEEELRRVIPVIRGLRDKTDVLISVDTTKSDVAEAALDEGADILNDISSFRFDDRMPLLVSEAGVPIILMHMKGVPKTMQNNPFYENLYQEIHCFLKERISTAVAYGIKKENIIIDPGIGFGKNLEHNLAVIKNLKFLEDLDQPIMVGVSRKSFIGKILNLPPQERVEGSIASAILSILNGAHILRVHDVQAVKRAVTVAEAIMNESSFPAPTERPDEETSIPHV